MVFQMSQDEISKDLFPFGEKKYLSMKTTPNDSPSSGVCIFIYFLISLENHIINCLYTTNQAHSYPKGNLKFEAGMAWNREERIG